MSDEFVKSAEKIQSTLIRCQYLKEFRGKKENYVCHGTVNINSPVWISPLSRLFPSVSFGKVICYNEPEEEYYSVSFEFLT